jgi:hypothetical protein
LFQPEKSPAVSECLSFLPEADVQPASVKCHKLTFRHGKLWNAVALQRDEQNSMGAI